MNAAAHRHRGPVLLRNSGFEDGPALTVQSTEGDIPHGRELSLAWLSGTVMTGLTSVLLMGAALYVSFQGQDTFSTAYEALRIATPDAEQQPTNFSVKTARVRPVTQTRSELESVEVAMRDPSTPGLITNSRFDRLQATLATAATSLSDDIPTYDPAAFAMEDQPETSAVAQVNTDIYGDRIDDQVRVKLASLPMSFVPARAISDQGAAAFVHTVVEGSYFEQDALDPVALAYAPANTSIRDLTPGGDSSGVIQGEAENVTIVPKATTAEDAGLGRTERILTLKEPASLEDTLLKNGFTANMIAAITGTLRNVYPSTKLPRGARLRILFGPSRNVDTLIPYRMSIYVHDNSANSDKHAATVAMTDKGQYVLALAPPDIVFPEEDTEEVNVSNLPSIYRSIWETGRKHDLDDPTIRKIIAMYAYDLDLTKKVSAGDSIEILQTAPDAEGHRELLYVGLHLGTTVKELFRYQSSNGSVAFFDPKGESGKQFLTRRPLQGGGVLRSNFGYRIHPIFHTRKLHTGVDLASKSGTPIYASGDGVIEKAGWTSGYGKYVRIKHVNGFETGYGHMSKIATTSKPGARVTQGQIIGYVGSTGNSTGPHLHFEILVNGRFVDPLSVKLPRDKTLPIQEQKSFEQKVAQIRDILARDPAPGATPVQVASAQ